VTTYVIESWLKTRYLAVTIAEYYQQGKDSYANLTFRNPASSQVSQQNYPQRRSCNPPTVSLLAHDPRALWIQRHQFRNLPHFEGKPSASVKCFFGWKMKKRARFSTASPNTAFKPIQKGWRKINGKGLGDFDVSPLPALSLQCT
jgi:hypothetical protein